MCNNDFKKLSQKEVNNAIDICMSLYGRDATIAALNKMYRDRKVTQKQLFGALDVINR